MFWWWWTFLWCASRQTAINFTFHHPSYVPTFFSRSMLLHDFAFNHFFLSFSPPPYRFMNRLAWEKTKFPFSFLFISHNCSSRGSEDFVSPAFNNLKCTNKIASNNVSRFPSPLKLVSTELLRSILFYWNSFSSNPQTTTRGYYEVTSILPHSIIIITVLCYDKLVEVLILLPNGNRRLAGSKKGGNGDDIIGKKCSFVHIVLIRFNMRN